MKLNIRVGEVTCYAARSGTAQSFCLSGNIPFFQMCCGGCDAHFYATEKPLKPQSILKTLYDLRQGTGWGVERYRKPGNQISPSLQFRDSPSILYCLPCMY